MSNIDKYAQVFVDSFGVEKSILDDKFVYQCIPTWDSVGHMSMIAALEDTFDIMMETMKAEVKLKLTSPLASFLLKLDCWGVFIDFLVA